MATALLTWAFYILMDQLICIAMGQPEGTLSPISLVSYGTKCWPPWSEAFSPFDPWTPTPEVLDDEWPQQAGRTNKKEGNIDMNVHEILATLKKLGRPQIAAIYKRHGSGDNIFGVLTSEIAKLQKKIKSDHALAMQLWRTGNAEARVLALQIADPAKLTVAEADTFANDAQSYYVGCYLGPLVARSPIAEGRMRAWMKSPKEFVRECGYTLLSSRLKDDPDSVSDADCESILGVIEREIHASPNRARYSMNGALIGIGVYKPSLRKKAIETAKRIGKVEVDHGETSCKTPDAVTSIAKAAKRKRCH